MADPFTNITVVLKNGATNNRTITGNLVVETGGTNTAALTGSLVMTGGSNSGGVTGTANITSATNSGNVSGDVFIVNGILGANTTVGGELHVTGGSSVVPSSVTVSGQIILSIDAPGNLGVLSTYTGTVISRAGENTLNSTVYVNGDAGTVTTLTDARYYNLEGDGKAYHYSAGSFTVFTGNAYNLTGDGKVYSWSGGDKVSLFTGVILVGSVYRYVDAGVVGALFNGAYYDVTSNNYRPVTDGVRINNAHADGVLQLDSDQKYYNFPGDGNAGSLFNGAYYDVTSSSYNPVTDGVRINNAYADGVLQLDSDQKYYTFNNTGNAGALFNGAYYDVTPNHHRPVTDGVRINNAYANGVLQLDSDQKYYNFPGDGNAGVLFDGAINIDGNYRPVTDGVPDNNAYANGVLQLDSDQKYYTFNNTGNAGVLFSGAYNNGNYKTVEAGVLNTSNNAYGILQLANDQKYYLFDGSDHLAAFTGAYYDGTNYRPVDAGVPSTSSYADGILQLVGDSKVYTFNDTGNLGTLFTGVTPIIGFSDLSAPQYKYRDIDSGVVDAVFTGAALINAYYYGIVSGLSTNSYASGILELANDNLYYTFNSTGDAGVLFNGILENNPSTSTVYNTYKDGAFYFSGTLYYYDASCDDPSQKVYLIIEGANIGDKAIQAGTGTASNYSSAGSKGGGFANTGNLYSFANGEISSIGNCDPYAAD